MITKKDVALKILQVGKTGFTTQEDGYKKLDKCIALIDKHVTEQLSIQGVIQQRELLIAFAKYMEEDKMYARHDEANVDDFLENYGN